MSDAARRAAEQVARQSYGRLIAFLARQSGDLASAEDALSEAFRAALDSWPVTGVPRSPEGWLLTAARRKLVDAARHARVVGDGLRSLLAMAGEGGSVAAAPSAFPDHRLELMFVAAHPAIHPDIHTPLMLQVVLGLDAATIASAFLVPPATMGQRLSRAKAKIRDARIPFDIPEAEALPPRLDAVLAAVYAAFALGADSARAAPAGNGPLMDEALALGDLLVRMMPAEPEVLGLGALMLHVAARRQAGTKDGVYVPLAGQDPADWDSTQIAAAEMLLQRAALAGRPGRFQLEAAIQSLHAGRRGGTEPMELARLYRGLNLTAPSLGALVAEAAALADAFDPATGLARLDALPAERIRAYQPYWATRAELLARLGRIEAAREAYERAIGLTASEAVRRFLTERRGRLGPA